MNIIKYVYSVQSSAKGGACKPGVIIVGGGGTLHNSIFFLIFTSDYTLIKFITFFINFNRKNFVFFLSTYFQIVKQRKRSCDTFLGLTHGLLKFYLAWTRILLGTALHRLLLGMVAFFFQGSAKMLPCTGRATFA